MDVRLRKFQFNSFNSRPRDTKISERSRNGLHRLGSHVAKTPDDDLPPPVPGPVSEEDLLDETEKQKIRTLTMEDSESENNREDDTVQEARGEREDEQSLHEDERAEENPKLLLVG